MKNLVETMLILLLVFSFGNLRGSSLAAQQPSQDQAQQPSQDQPQQPSQDQQTPPQESQNPQASQGSATSSASVQSMTGCLTKTDSGFALKTDTDTVPLETGKDLSQYVGKQIKVTGILEHHNAASSSANGSPATITDLRLRLIASVVGDCAPSAK
jgi:hypothetical protein